MYHATHEVCIFLYHSLFRILTNVEEIESDEMAYMTAPIAVLREKLEARAGELDTARELCTTIETQFERLRDNQRALDACLHSFMQRGDQV